MNIGTEDMFVDSPLLAELAAGTEKFAMGIESFAIKRKITSIKAINAIFLL
jgi:hypothetical protein